MSTDGFKRPARPHGLPSNRQAKPHARMSDVHARRSQPLPAPAPRLPARPANTTVHHRPPESAEPLEAPEPREEPVSDDFPQLPAADGFEELQPHQGRSKRRIAMVVVGGILGLVVCAALACIAWYQAQLQPVSSDNTAVGVVIASGSTPTVIGKQLVASGLIRSEQAFTLYTQFSGTKGILKAGSYKLHKSDSLPEIVRKLVTGGEVEFNLTFLPGDTLANHRKRLISAGFTASDVDKALADTSYAFPALFAGKPTTSDFEGYIYGETYRFSDQATPHDVLTRIFGHFETIVEENKLTEKFAKRGLSLYQGITLASVIQRETSNPDSQKQVASVFYNRLAIGMQLGSDVTYQYAADKLGVARDPGLDSPYNTRKFAGLPPGPISSPGLSALQAASEPAPNDYLFFLSGDDNVMYYAKTDAEHQKNATDHCQKKCQIL